MSACDTCRKPGFCCENIRLFGAVPMATANGEVTFPASLDAVKVLASIQGEDLPYRPARILRTIEPRPLPDWDGPLIGETLHTWSWACPRLTAEGRCGEYEQRPWMCRSFEPVKDTFCLMNPETNGRDPRVVTPE